MTALEAFKLSVNSIKSELDIIYKEISLVCNKGNTSIQLDEISNTALKELSNNGYIIQFYTNKYIISW